MWCLGIWFIGDLAAFNSHLDLVMLKVFSNLYDSVYSVYNGDVRLMPRFGGSSPMYLLLRRTKVTKGVWQGESHERFKVQGHSQRAVIHGSS